MQQCDCLSCTCFPISHSRAVALRAQLEPFQIQLLQPPIEQQINGANRVSLAARAVSATNNNKKKPREVSARETENQLPVASLRLMTSTTKDDEWCESRHEQPVSLSLFIFSLAPLLQPLQIQTQTQTQTLT